MAIVICVSLVYILTMSKATITVRIVHVVEHEYGPPQEPEEGQEPTENTFDVALKKVQESINAVNGTGGRNNGN